MSNTLVNFINLRLVAVADISGELEAPINGLRDEVIEMIPIIAGLMAAVIGIGLLIGITDSGKRAAAVVSFVLLVVAAAVTGPLAGTFA